MTSFLAVDIGTTNWKAAVFCDDGRPLAQFGVAAPLRRGAAGDHYDPEELWRRLGDITRKALAGQPSPAAVCVTSMAEAGVPVDYAGAPVYPIVPWFDLRSLPQAQALNTAVGSAQLFATTGLDPNPIFSLPKIAWLRDEQPRAYSQMAKWLSVADFVNFRLCGEMVTDYSLASRTLAFDLDKAAWSCEVITAAGLRPSGFPEVAAAGTAIGRVTSRGSAETGIPCDTPVVLGGHDHHCAYLAAGALIDEVVLDSSGTAESVMTLLPAGSIRPKDFRGMRVGFFIDPARYATMGGILASGASVDWAMEAIWQDGVRGGNGLAESYEAASNAAASVPPGCRGLLFVPHLRGAGAPVWEPRARGAFVGLTAAHKKPELLRAVFEGLCFELRVLLDAVDHAFGAKARGLNTVGGGAKSGLWQQIKADVTGLTVNVPDVKDATALGAAILAGVGVGAYSNLMEATKRVFREKNRFLPTAINRDRYERLYGLYRPLFPQLREINVALTDLA